MGPSTMGGGEDRKQDPENTKIENRKTRGSTSSGVVPPVTGSGCMFLFREGPKKKRIPRIVENKKKEETQNTKENRQKSNSYLKDNSRRLYSVTLPLNTRTPDFFSRCF